MNIQDLEPSAFFDGMSGSLLPITVCHGEGRAEFSHPTEVQSLNEGGLIPLRYIDNCGSVTHKYHFNPNGQPLGYRWCESPAVFAMMPQSDTHSDNPTKTFQDVVPLDGLESIV